jgi:spore coat polysaccharide biosynthesis protein SpsF (cytidylyltransferase family)
LLLLSTTLLNIYYKMKKNYKILLQYYFAHVDLPDNSIYKKKYFGKTILEYTLSNLLEVFSEEDIVLFISNDFLSTENISLIDSYNIKYISIAPGAISESLVEYIKGLDLDYIVRLIANNPFLDSLMIRESIKSLEDKPCDYLSFTNTPKGLSPAEIINVNYLQSSLNQKEFQKYLNNTKVMNVLSYLKKNTSSHRAYDTQLSKYQHLDLSINSEKDIKYFSDYLKDNKKIDLEKLSSNYLGKIISTHIEPTNQCNLPINVTLIVLCVHVCLERHLEQFIMMSLKRLLTRYQT